MISRLSKILLAILLPFACGPAFAGKRVALVLGNSAYQSVPRLTNPANDAALMTDTSRRRAYCETQPVHTLGQKQTSGGRC